MSASCTALFILVLYDYYRNCQVSGIDGLCFYGDYYIFGTFDFNSKVWPGWNQLIYRRRAAAAPAAFNGTIFHAASQCADFMHTCMW